MPNKALVLHVMKLKSYKRLSIIYKNTILKEKTDDKPSMFTP